MRPYWKFSDQIPSRWYILICILCELCPQHLLLQNTPLLSPPQRDTTLNPTQMIPAGIWNPYPLEQLQIIIPQSQRKSETPPDTQVRHPFMFPERGDTPDLHYGQSLQCWTETLQHWSSVVDIWWTWEHITNPHVIGYQTRVRISQFATNAMIWLWQDSSVELQSSN